METLEVGNLKPPTPLHWIQTCYTDIMANPSLFYGSWIKIRLKIKYSCFTSHQLQKVRSKNVKSTIESPLRILLSQIQTAKSAGAKLLKIYGEEVFTKPNFWRCVVKKCSQTLKWMWHPFEGQKQTPQNVRWKSVHKPSNGCHIHLKVGPIFQEIGRILWNLWFDMRSCLEATLQWMAAFVQKVKNLQM